MESSAIVYNIQRYSLHDGPGIRTNVFLKGCPLRCRWCCNPESQEYKPETTCLPASCIGEEGCGFCRRACPAGAVSFAAGKVQIDRKHCSSCLRCADACPAKAIRVAGESKTVSEVLAVVEEDAVFFRGLGGLTVSGGEPLGQGEFLINLLEEAKRRRLNTAVETCGYGSYEVLRRAASNLDTILFDIKSIDKEKHIAYTGKSNDIILDNFEQLCEQFPELDIVVRTPIIPGFNDSVEEIAAIVEFLAGKPQVRYETLPYHRFGEGKYAALGRAYPMGDKVLEAERMTAIREMVSRKRSCIIGADMVK